MGFRDGFRLIFTIRFVLSTKVSISSSRHSESKITANHESLSPMPLFIGTDAVLSNCFSRSLIEIASYS